MTTQAAPLASASISTFADRTRAERHGSDGEDADGETHQPVTRTWRAESDRCHRRRGRRARDRAPPPPPRWRG